MLLLDACSHLFNDRIESAVFGQTVFQQPAQFHLIKQGLSIALLNATPQPFDRLRTEYRFA